MAKTQLIQAMQAFNRKTQSCLNLQNYAPSLYNIGLGKDPATMTFLKTGMNIQEAVCYFSGYRDAVISQNFTLTEEPSHCLIESLALEATRRWAESAGIPFYDNSDSPGNAHGLYSESLEYFNQSKESFAKVFNKQTCTPCLKK